MKIKRHFTATTNIVHKKKALLHLHKKLGIWIPVGGHINENELPHVAALREIKEESGLEVELYNPDKKIIMSDAENLIRPIHIILEDIEEDHKHIDLIYYAYADTFEVSSLAGETDELKWYTEEELTHLENCPDNAKLLAIEAIKLLS